MQDVTPTRQKNEVQVQKDQSGNKTGSKEAEKSSGSSTPQQKKKDKDVAVGQQQKGDGQLGSMFERLKKKVVDTASSVTVHLVFHSPFYSHHHKCPRIK
jgi:hypothetical protein